MPLGNLSDDDDDDLTEAEDDSGTFGQVLGGTGSTGVSSSGSIGQQIHQRVSGGSQSTSGSGNVTWPNVGTAGQQGPSFIPIGSNTQHAPQKVTWNSGTIATKKMYTKTRVRYVVVAKDQTTRELKELDQITPIEMIGISKFVSLVSTYAILVFGQAVIDYNFNISWSEIIDSLGISKHFAPGLALDEYDTDASEVLDILLHDPQ